MIENDRADVLLVGSLPFDTADESMRSAGKMLGTHLPAIGDGEVGLRKIWVGFLPQTVYSKNPALEILRSPDTEIQQQPDERPEVWDVSFLFGIKPGEKLRIDTLNYGPIAVESYETFKQLRDEGVIPEGVRYLVTFPGTGSACSFFFGNPEQWPEAQAAYHDAIEQDIATILEHVPAEDLTLQFDFASEFIDMASGDKLAISHWPEATLEQKIERHAAPLAELTRSIPDEVQLGMHWCYGTWGGWPMKDMADLSLCVRMTKEAIARVPRKLDYVHMPVLMDPDAGFFSPLAELNDEEVDVYLGIVHHADGVEGFERRMQMAREHYTRPFGIGSVCGYGRIPAEELPDILALHRDCAAKLRS